MALTDRYVPEIAGGLVQTLTGVSRQGDSQQAHRFVTDGTA